MSSTHPKTYGNGAHGYRGVRRILLDFEDTHHVPQLQWHYGLLMLGKPNNCTNIVLTDICSFHRPRTGSHTVDYRFSLVANRVYRSFTCSHLFHLTVVDSRRGTKPPLSAWIHWPPLLKIH